MGSRPSPPRSPALPASGRRSRPPSGVVGGCSDGPPRRPRPALPAVRPDLGRPWTRSSVRVLNPFSPFLCAQCHGRPFCPPSGDPSPFLVPGGFSSFRDVSVPSFPRDLGAKGACLSLEPKPSVGSPPLSSICSSERVWSECLSALSEWGSSSRVPEGQVAACAAA